MEKLITISIVVCTHNRCVLLNKTLSSLRLLVVPDNVNIEIIVVLNKCTDKSKTVVNEYQVLAVEEDRLGLCYARNNGMHVAKGDYVVFLDDDVKVSCTWLQNIHDTILFYQPDVIVGRVTLWWECVQRPEWYDSRHAWALSEFDRGHKSYRLDTVEGIGANFAFSRLALEVLGPFNTCLDRVGKTLSAGGDTEYINRAMTSGLNVYYSPAEVSHYVKVDRLKKRAFFRLGYHQGIALVSIKKYIRVGSIIRSVCGYSILASIYTIFSLVYVVFRNEGGVRHSLGRAGCGYGGVLEWLSRLWTRE